MLSLVGFLIAINITWRSIPKSPARSCVRPNWQTRISYEPLTCQHGQRATPESTRRRSIDRARGGGRHGSKFRSPLGTQPDPEFATVDGKTPGETIVVNVRWEAN